MPDDVERAEQRFAVGPARDRSWVERLHAHRTSATTPALTLSSGPSRSCCVGANGSGKTNLLEAVSLLAPARACAARPIPSWPRSAKRGWAVAAHLRTHARRRRHRHRPRPARSRPAHRPHRAHRRRGPVRLRRARRLCRDGLADAGHGRPVHRPRLRAPPLPRSPDPLLRSRLPHARSASSSAPCSSATACSPTACATPPASTGFERIMAETGVAIAAARAAAVAELAAAIGVRRDAREPAVAFPWAELALAGTLETRSRSAARRRRGGRLRRARCAPDASAIAPPAARWRGRTAPT